MSLFSTLFIIIVHIAVAIKAMNLNPTTETNEDPFDNYNSFQDSSFKIDVKTAPSDYVTVPVILKYSEEDLLEMPEIKLSNRTQRSAIEEDKNSLLDLAKPIRRVRHRGGTLKNEDHILKGPHLSKTVNETEVIKSNTNANIIEESNAAVQDNMKSMGFIEMPSKYISVVKDPKIMIPNANEIRTIEDHTPNEIVNRQEEIIERYDTKVTADQYNQEPNRINMKSLEANENIYHKLYGARPRFDQQEFIDKSGPGFVAKQLQYNEDYYPNQPYYYNTYQKSSRGQENDHSVFTDSNSGNFEAKQYEEYPNKAYDTYQNLLRDTQGNNHQMLMENNGARATAKQYYEKDPQRQNMKLLETGGNNIYQNLYGTRPKFDQQVLMERSGVGFEAEPYDGYRNQPNNIYHNLYDVAQINNHQKLVERNDDTIRTGQYNNKNMYRPNNIKSVEINGRTRHIRPRFEHQEQIENNRAGVKAELFNENDQNPSNTKSLEANKHIHYKLLGHTQRPTFDHQESMEIKEVKIETQQYDRDRNENLSKIITLETNRDNNQILLRPKPIFSEGNDARIIAGAYYNEDPNRLDTQSIEINRHIRPSFNHQEHIEIKSERIETEQYERDPNQLNMDSSETNGYNINQNFLQGNPSFKHQQLMQKNSDGITGEQYSKEDLNQRNVKYLESNGHNISLKLLQARPRFDHQELVKDKGIIIEPNQNERNTIQNLSDTKGRLEQQELEERKVSKTFSVQYKEYSKHLSQNSVGNANIDEPIFEDIREPEKELMGRDNAEIVSEHKEVFKTNIKAKDTSDNEKLTEAARSGEQEMGIIHDDNTRHGSEIRPDDDTRPGADIRYGAEPEHHREHTNQPNIINFGNANTHQTVLEEKSVQPINIHRNKVMMITPKIVHLVPRIQQLVVFPRCRLVPQCSRLYLPKRCTKLKMKCGLI